MLTLYFIKISEKLHKIENNGPLPHPLGEIDSVSVQNAGSMSIANSILLFNVFYASSNTYRGVTCTCSDRDISNDGSIKNKPLFLLK